MLASPPFTTTLTTANGVTRQWLYWLTSLWQAVNAAPQQVGAVSLTAQTASLAATAVPILTVTQGLYRVTTYARVTTAATSSSSLTVTVGWTDGGVACSQSASALTGNTTSTTGSQSVIVAADNASAITYATTYSSTGATAMQYGLAVRVEQLP